MADSGEEVHVVSYDVGHVDRGEGDDVEVGGGRAEELALGRGGGGGDDDEADVEVMVGDEATS